MDNNYLYLIWFIFYLLVPVIPATVIFKLFPDTRVKLFKESDGFQLNTTGAFAAYLVTIGAGYFIMNNAMETLAIDKSMDSAYYIKAQIMADSENDEEQKQNDELCSFAQNLRINIKPDIIQDRSNNCITLRVPKGMFFSDYMLSISSNYSEFKPIDLSFKQLKTHIKSNEDENTIELGIIPMKKIAAPSDPKTYSRKAFDEKPIKGSPPPPKERSQL